MAIPSATGAGDGLVVPHGGGAPKAKLPALTSLRFFAAAIVAFYHIRGSFDLPMWYAEVLNQGVSIFFVLSGFILTYVYPELPSWPSAGRFLRARIARIWPAYIASMVLAVLIYPASVTALDTPALIGRLATNVLMIQTWWPAGPASISINGPSWSISTEAAFYCLFPLLIWRLRTRWWINLILCLCVAAATMLAVTVLRIPFYEVGAGHSLTADGLIYISPLGRTFEFVCGMCAALAWRRFHQRISIGPLPGTAIEIASILLLVFCTTLVFSAMNAVGLPPSPVLGRWLSQAGASAVPAAILMFVLASQFGWVSRALAVAPLVLLGELSYSIYLVHYPLLTFHDHNFSRLAHLPNWLCLGVYIALLIMIPYLIWVLIERPGRALLLQSRGDGALPHPRIAVATVLALTCVLCGLSVYRVASPRLVSEAHAAQLTSRVPEELRNAAFGSSAELRGYDFTPFRDGQALHLIWHARGKFDRKLNVAVHLVKEAGGPILAQADYQTTRLPAQPGQTFEDTVFLSAAQLRGACYAGIAIYPRGTGNLFPVDRGLRDWNGGRLLIPLPASAECR
jgi:peptidoglycan/LPS O-acetylase OafA/YrhL